MNKIANVLLLVIIVFGTAFLIYEYKVSMNVTVRDIEHASGSYIYPYSTHGGTVYVTRNEGFILGIAKNIVTGLFAFIIIVKLALSARPKTT